MQGNIHSLLTPIDTVQMEEETSVVRVDSSANHLIIVNGLVFS